AAPATIRSPDSLARGAGQQLASSRPTEIIHPTIAARTRKPAVAMVQLARSSSRNSFDGTARTPLKVRNTVAVRGARVTDETVRSAWPASISRTPRVQAAMNATRRAATSEAHSINAAVTETIKEM